MRKFKGVELRFQILSLLEKSKSGLTPTELTDKLADIFKLTRKEREEVYSKRAYDKVFYKRVASEEQRLKNVGLEIFSNNVHQITEKGIEVLQELKTTVFNNKNFFEHFFISEIKKQIISKGISIDKEGKPHYANIREGNCTMYIVPRDKFKRNIDVDLIKYPALYILIDSFGGETECYIGCTGNPIERISTHKSKSRGIDFWKYALIIEFYNKSSDNHFDKSDVEYLEHLAIKLAKKCQLDKQKKISNAKGADEPYIKEHAKKEMDEAFEDVKRLISKVGLTIFDN
jgi:hypothetical protein